MGKGQLKCTLCLALSLLTGFLQKYFVYDPVITLQTLELDVLVAILRVIVPTHWCYIDGYYDCV